MYASTYEYVYEREHARAYAWTHVDVCVHACMYMYLFLCNCTHKYATVEGCTISVLCIHSLIEPSSVTWISATFEFL